MVFSSEFDEALARLFDKEVEREVKESFIEILCGDWAESDIRDILKRLREKAKDENSTDLLLLYLVAEILNEGKLSLTWEKYMESEDDLDPISTPVNVKDCLCEENKLIINTPEGFFEIELKGASVNG